MAAPTPTLIKNSGRGYRRYGRNNLQVFATSGATDNWTAQVLIDLSIAFVQLPRPIGLKIFKLDGWADGTCTNIKFDFDFKTDVKVADFISPNEKNKFKWREGIKSPTSEMLDTCVTSWTAASNVTPADETTIVVPGTSETTPTSQKFTIAAAFTTGIIGYATTYSAVDASAWDGVSLYIYSSIDLQPGDLSFCIDDTASIASPVETLVINMAIKAGEWNFVKLDFVTATARTAIVSHGLKANRDFGAGVIYVDNIRYRKKSQKFSSGDSGTHNAGAYGDLVCTTLGIANNDVLYFDVDFEFTYKEDSLR